DADLQLGDRGDGRRRCSSPRAGPGRGPASKHARGIRPAIHDGDRADLSFGVSARHAGARARGVRLRGPAPRAGRGARGGADLLEAPLEDLELVDGSIRVRGTPTSGLTVAQLAQKAYFAPTELPPGMEPGLEATHAFDPPPLTFSSGTHICQVEIDPETGGLTITRYTIVEDCGRMLNPRVVEGQVHGATAQGLGGALMEEIVYDADGQNRCAT